MVLKGIVPPISALLLSVGCTVESSRPPLPAPPASPDSIAVPDSKPPLSWADSIDAVEVAAIRASDGKVARAGSELRIRLIDGRTAVFKDDPSPGPRWGIPRYAGYIKAIHSHVVHLLPYEGSGTYLVVDDSTGDSTRVFGIPVPSPDGTRFAVTAMEREGDDASLIEVWRIVSKKPEKEFSHDTENEAWSPSDAVWRDSVTIDFVKNSGDDPSAPTIKAPGRLTRAGTTWILSEPPH